MNFNKSYVILNVLKCGATYLFVRVVDMLSYNRSFILKNSEEYLVFPYLFLHTSQLQ